VFSLFLRFFEKCLEIGRESGKSGAEFLVKVRFYTAENTVFTLF